MLEVRQIGIESMSLPVFYIYTPDYTPYSSGIRVLHILCHKLNLLGFESYVVSKVVSVEFNTPVLSQATIDLHKKQGRMQITIYAESEMGNPLQSTNVIRWLLNKPNFFYQNWFGEFDQNEFIVHHDEGFRPPWIQSNGQFIPHVDRTLFNTKNVAEKREGLIIYSHRVEVAEKYPDWITKIEYISSSNRKTPEECAEMYKRASALVVYERAAAHAEAGLCGCPTIFRENEKYNADYIFSSYWSMSSFKDFDPNISTLNQGNGVKLEKIYDDEDAMHTQLLDQLIRRSIEFFNLRSSLNPEDFPSIWLAQCQLLLNKQDFFSAGKVLEKIFSFPEISNRALYYYFRFAKETGNDIEAKQILRMLNEKLDSYKSEEFMGRLIQKINSDNFAI
jgi:hypothetical protein